MIRVLEVENTIRVTTPFNPEFVQVARNMGGRWISSARAWEFDLRSLEPVRATLRRFFGEDGRPVRRVSVRVKALSNLAKRKGPFILFGRVIAAATGRDSGVKVGDGVAFVEGKPCAGGSDKNWFTEIPENTEFLVHDVPETMAEREKKDTEGRMCMEIIDSFPRPFPDPDVLLREILSDPGVECLSAGLLEKIRMRVEN